MQAAHLSRGGSLSPSAAPSRRPTPGFCHLVSLQRGTLQGAPSVSKLRQNSHQHHQGRTKPPHHARDFPTQRPTKFPPATRGPPPQKLTPPRGTPSPSPSFRPHSDADHQATRGPRSLRGAGMFVGANGNKQATPLHRCRRVPPLPLTLPPATSRPGRRSAPSQPGRAASLAPVQSHSESTDSPQSSESSTLSPAGAGSVPLVCPSGALSCCSRCARAEPSRLSSR